MPKNFKNPGPREKNLKVYSTKLVAWCSVWIALIAPLACHGASNAIGWKLLMDNKPLEAREIFSKNIHDKDPGAAGEAYRGLSEVCSFLGEDQDAARSVFLSCLADHRVDLFLAAIIKAYPFGSVASGATIKEGYKLLEELTGKRDIFSGELCDLLASRYLNDGKIGAAQRIVESMGAIGNWMMIGPFDNVSNCGFAKAYGPEQRIDFSKTYEAKDGNMAQWNPIRNTAATGWIFLENHTSAVDAAFYFYCCVTSPQTQQVNLAFGASGSFKIMLNGSLVLADSIFRNTGDDMFMQRVTLHKGDNPLLVKLCGEWRGQPTEVRSRLANFSLRFLSDRFVPVKSLHYSTRPAGPVAPADPAVVLGDYAPSPLADSIIKPLLARLEKNGDDPDAALLYMNCLNGMEKTDEGQLLAQKYIAQYPGSSLWRGLLSECLLRAKKYTEGSAELKTAFSRCPLNFAAWENELQTISRNADVRKVMEFIENSPQQFKGSLPALLADLDAYMELENKAEAFQIINRIEEKFSSDYSAVSVLANLYERQGDVKKAENLLKKYIRHERASPALYKALASMYVKQGDTRAAAKAIDDALEYSPCDAGLLYYLADLQYSQKKFDRARENIDRCCALRPADANALTLRGNILASLNEKDKAKAAFVDAIRFTNDDFNAWENLRSLEGKPGLESLAALPSPDSLIKASADWRYGDNESGAVLSSIHDVFYYPSRCSRERTFLLVRLPTQKAIDQWKERTIDYNGYFQSLSIERALSYTSRGTQVQADIQDNKIVFKSLEPGDCIALEWSIKNYFMGKMAKQVFGEEDFQLFYPVLDSWLRFITPENDTVPYTVYGDSISVNRRAAGDYRVTAFNRKSYKNLLDESFMATDWPENRKVCYSTFSGWGDIAAWYDDLTRHKLDNSLELKALADSLFGPCKTPREKISRMHDYITENIRYSSLSFRQSGWIPQDARDVLATKIGDCKDMASLGRSLLTYAGIPSCLVLVNTEIRHFTDHAAIGPDFNHCILCYTLEGKDCFMDLTDNDLSAFSLPKDDQGAMALVIRPGACAVMELPFDSASQRTKKRALTQRLDTNGLLTERAQNVRTGVFAAQYRRMFRFLSEEKKQAAMRQILGRLYPDMTLKKFDIDSALNTAGDTLGYTYEFTAKNAVTFSGSTAIFALHVPDQVEPSEYPMEEKRNFPVDLFQTDYDVGHQETRGELTFPRGWRPITLPRKVSISSEFGSYLFEFEQKGNRLLYHRKAVFTILRQIPVGDYARLKDFLNTVAKSDAVQLLFFTH